MNHEKILFLGNADSPVFHYLNSVEACVVQTAEPIDARWLKNQQVDFLVSYGYRFILGEEVLQLLPNKAINLHISYLPWNRGSDPNFWSFYDNTPKGVTIHYLDKGVDTGDIIVQQTVEFNKPLETLASSYTKLQALIEELFTLHWDDIKYAKCSRIPQTTGGSCHLHSALAEMQSLLNEGWNTPVKNIFEAGVVARGQKKNRQ